MKEKIGKAYCCKICEKFFKEPEFVIKHIKNKHADVLNEKFNADHFRTITRDNYLQDPNRISYAQAKDSQTTEYVRRDPPQRGRGGGGHFHQRGGRAGHGFGHNQDHRGGGDWNMGMETEQTIEQNMMRPIEEYQDFDDPAFATSSTSYSQGNRKPALIPGTQPLITPLVAAT